MMRQAFPNRRWTALVFAAIAFSGVWGATFGQGPKNALSFDGVDDHLDCGRQSSMRISPDISIEAWVKTTQSGATKQIVGKQWWDPKGYSYMFALDARRPAVLLGGTSQDDWIIAPTLVPSGQWTHIAFTYNGSQAGSQVKIYINGILDQQVSVSGEINWNASKNVWIGDREDLPGHAYQGEMDEVRIWSKALSPDEIRSAMCRKLVGSESDLAACWRFDEGTGTTAADLSPNLNTGTLVNGPAWTISGAAIGDESAFVYPGGPLSLSHPDGDAFAVGAVTGAPEGLHIYRVDSAPNVTTPPGGYAELDPMRYWGVFVAGGTSPTYTATYNFDGHPGIVDESALKLAKRADNAAPSWSDSGAILDTIGNTLTATGQTGTEYILGSTTAQFCTDILLFAHKNPGQTDIILTWSPACDSNNRYAVHRSLDAQTVRQPPEIAMVTGLTYTEPLPEGALVFYNILPQSTQFTLSFTGELDPDCSGFPCDNGSPGFTVAGFCPTPVEPYLDGTADLALSGDSSTFRVLLTSTSGSLPTAFMDLLVDRDDDGLYTGPGEVVPLAEADSGDVNTTDGKIYFAVLDGVDPLGTPASATSRLYARDAAGNPRWAFADGAGALHYTFRASDGVMVSGGPASETLNLTLLNTARELVQELGKPLVAAGACGSGTDWHTALTYFQEAEVRAAPLSPYNLAGVPNQNPDYLDALLASAISETAYTLVHYQTLFESPGTKLYRDTMLDWKAFADKQVARMEHLSLWAPSQPDTPWELQLPQFCIWLEGDTAPLMNLAGLAGSGLTESLLGLPIPDLAVPASPLLGLPTDPTPDQSEGYAPAAAPAYTFEAARWDRTDAHMLAALFHGWRAAAIAYRVYEDPLASRLVTAGDLGDIGIWLKPEADAKAHAQCSPPPCPPLNGVDDDLDGLVDDLGYAARVFETFDGVGNYSAEPGLGFTLEAATNDASSASAHLREALRLVLMEGDTQADNATLIYGDGGSHPPLFTDVESYNGLQINGDPCPAPPAVCPDGLPDLEFLSGAFLPVPWCPPALPGDPQPPLYLTPVTLRGGLGDDITWWVKELVQAYNKATGTTYDPLCYPEGWVYTLYATEWGYTMERAVADTTPHYTLNLRDDVESALQKNGVDPADLGPDFQTFLVFLQDIDIRLFIESPENLRGVLPHFCPTHTEPPCAAAENYSFNGFWGDWDEPTDPIVSGKFWTIEPFSTFNQDANGILVDPSGPCTPEVPYNPDADCHCDPSRLNTDRDCIRVGWNDLNANGKFDLFEPVLMADASTPQSYIDLNRDGQWNGWTDTLHEKVSYAGDPTHPGSGLYNGLYVYSQDPTFGGRLPGVTNESLNNFIGTAAGWADGLLSFPSNNHAPANYHMVEDTPTTVQGANLRLVITATDPDGDALHYHMVLPAGVQLLLDGRDTGIYELAVPTGTWGLIGIVYDNVNNLNDLAGMYLEVVR